MVSGCWACPCGVFCLWELAGWLGVWLGSLGVSCFRLRVLSMFVEVLYGCRRSFRDKPARSYENVFRSSDVRAASQLVPQAIIRFLTHTLKFSLRQPPVHIPIRLTPHQHEVHDPSHLMGNRHSGAPSAPPPRHPLIEPPEPEIKPNRSLSTLHQRPPEPLIARRGTADPNLLPGLMHRRRQPHPRRELLLAAEPADVAARATER